MGLPSWRGCMSRPEAGLYLQLVSGMCASAMGLTAKLAGGLGVPVMEIVLARSLVVLALSTSMLAAEGRQARWPWRSSRRWLLLWRAFVGFGGISCYYAAVQLLPLADVAVLSFLSPIFVALLAPLVLGEGRGGLVVVASLPICMAGVVLVARPTFLFGGSSQGLSAAGVAIGILQAMFMASARLSVRALGKSEPISSIMLSMAALSVLGSCVLSLAIPGQRLITPPSAAAWGLLLAAGLLACGVQSLATLALKLSKATTTSMMNYLGVVWGMLIDFAVYCHAPTALGLLGAGLVCSSSFFIILSEQRQDGSVGPPGSSSATGANGADVAPAGDGLSEGWKGGTSRDSAALQLQAAAGRASRQRQEQQLELAEAGANRQAGQLAAADGAAEEEGGGGDAERAPLLQGQMHLSGQSAAGG